jgi:hypothetical protein
VKSTAFVFATDLVDEGYDVVLDRLRDAGVDGVTLACNYHHSRDVFPHNPVRRVRFFHGEVYFAADGSRYDGIQPPVAEMVGDFDPLQRLVEEAGARGMAVHGWTNNTHNSRLGAAYPDCTARTCFGDPLVFALCPANPAVRTYITALSADLAQRGLASLTCETLGYLPFDHGWHHERSYAPLSTAARFVMGLCFCEHCRAGAGERGVDVDALQRRCRDELQLALDGAPRALGDEVPVERDAIAALADGMAGYLDARSAAVTSLAAAVTRACGDVPVSFMDVSGGLRGAGSGMQASGDDRDATARSWQEGTDLTAIAEACDGIEMLGYSHDLDAIETDLRAYLAYVEPARLSVALRPMAPDALSPDDLTAKLELLDRAGVERVDFYHYAFIPLANLQWIRAALGAISA